MFKFSLPSILLLTTLSLTAQAQPTPPKSNISQDSVALFTIEEDALQPGRELLRHKGFVTNLQATPEGRVSLAIFRQQTVYLTTPKGGGVFAPGINTLPGLMRVSYNDGRFGPVQDTPLNLNSGLKTPLPFRANRISSFVGGIQTEGLVADQTMATDLNTLLTDDPQALGYQGDRFTRSRVGMVGGSVIVDKQAFQYVPFAARYLPLGKPTMQAFEQIAGAKLAPWHTTYALQGRVTYYHYGQKTFITIDSTGKAIRQLDYPMPEGLTLLGRAEVIGTPKGPIVRAGETRPVLGTDWLLGPNKVMTQNPQFRLIRTDTDGNIVFDHPFTVSHEDYGFTQMSLVSDEGGAFVKIVLGKGVLKYQLAYAHITPKGVAWQRIWDKKDPADHVQVGGSHPFIAFANLERLVSLPNGQTLLIYHDMFKTQFLSYGMLLLSATGNLLRYFTIKPRGKAVGAEAPTLRIMPLADGRVLLVSNEDRNEGASQFAPFTLMDLELQQHLEPHPQVLPGQKSLLYNVSTGPTVFPAAYLPDPTVGGGGLSGISFGKAKELKSATGERIKAREPIETNTFNTSPVVYLLDPQSNKIIMRDMGSRGYSLPNQPSVLFNLALNEAYFPLRTPPQPTAWPRSARYPQAVYLKLVKFSW